jgi:hypothetical protein
MNVTEQHKAAARNAIRRGAKPGEPIPRCRCFQDGAAAILSRPNCNGVCEDAVDHVARTIVDALSAERARVIALAKALKPFADMADEIERTASKAACDAGNVVGPARWDDCKRARAALRALGQQDTGGVT